MNLVTLLNTDMITLTSGKLVYGPDETGALKSAVAAAESLVAEQASAAERVAEAVEAGRDNGYKDGFESGLQAARAQIASEIASLARQAQAQLQQQRNHTADMAVQIVRKIAAQLGEAQTLAALAHQAAQEFAQDEIITLRVHPAHVESVRLRLRDLQQTGESVAHLTNVVADAELADTGCVLDSRFGSVVADLDTQLNAISAHLEQRDDG